MADRAGLVKMTIAESNYDVKGSVTIRPTRFSREAIEGLDGYHGTKVVPKACGASGTITDAAGLKLADLQKLIGVEVYFELSNGKQYKLHGATFLDQAELDVGEGEIAFEFAAETCSEY